MFQYPVNIDIQILTPEYFNKMKMKFYGSKEKYERDLTRFRKRYVRKFSPDKHSDYTKKYGDIANKCNITDLSDNITYEIQTFRYEIILIFINPKTQKSKLCFKDVHSGKCMKSDMVEMLNFLLILY